MAKRRTVITQVPPGAAVPAGEPRRYVGGHGYVRLRWRVAPYTYVECYEHRVVDGFVVGAGLHRHHINQQRDDNRPDNLATLTPDEHEEIHNHCDVLDQIVELYRSGLSTVEVGRRVGRDPAVVYRHLVAQGVPIRNQVRPVDDAEREEIAQLFREGLSWSEIERRTGRSSQTLARIRRACEDVPRRRPGIQVAR